MSFHLTSIQFTSQCYAYVNLGSKWYSIKYTILEPDMKGILTVLGGCFGIQNPSGVTKKGNMNVGHIVKTAQSCLIPQNNLNIDDLYNRY